MTNRQIVEKISRLPLSEKISIVETILKDINKESKNDLSLANGAKTLLEDYRHDIELTLSLRLIARIFMKRNEVWLIDLNPTIGAEIQKTRPALIVNDDDLGLLPLRVIVPLTDWKEKMRPLLG